MNELKWYGKDTPPKHGQKVIAFYREYPDNNPATRVEEYKYAGGVRIKTFLDIAGFVAWTPLPMTPGELEKQKLQNDLDSVEIQLRNLLQVGYLNTGDISKDFLNQMLNLLERLKK